jgi:hypothetical protein
MRVVVIVKANQNAVIKSARTATAAYNNRSA